MILKANAKINIALDVIKKRDNFHILNTIILPVEMHDVIHVRKLSKNDNLKTFVMFENFKVKLKDNICNKFVLFITDFFNIKDKYKFVIRKKIPIKSGLGGESSDVASIFKFYINKYKLNLSIEEQIKIALKFGCDIPFFLINKPSNVSGIGEKIKLIKVSKTYNVLIIKPKNSHGLLTKTIFDLFDKETKNKKIVNIKNVIKSLANGDKKMLKNNINNSLEDVASKIVPNIKIIKKFLIDNRIMAVMTGTGDCVVSLYDNYEKDKIYKILNMLKTKIDVQIFKTKIIK